MTEFPRVSLPPAVEIDPQMAAILAEAAGAPRLDPLVTPLRAQRRAVEMAAAVWNDPPFACAEVVDLTFPTGHGPRRARLYRPAGASDGSLVLYAHGGGWTFGSLDSHDGLARRLATACRRPLLAIDYRLAPEHPHPAPLEDVAAAFAFVEGGGIGRRLPAARVAVAGDSAGAQTMLALLLSRRDARLPTAGAGLLFYGCFAPDFDTDSHRTFGRDESFLLSSERMRWYWANHLGGAADPGLAAPLFADLHDLPPLFLDAAGLDPLRDDSTRLAARLDAAGVPHRLHLTPGVVHGYLRFARRLTAADGTFAAAAAHLSDVLGDD